MTRIPKKYKPSEKEKFMNQKMKEYFKLKLINWKKELLKESFITLKNLKTEENTAKPDITDRAHDEIERTIELRTRDRERKLINKIDKTLHIIDIGEYGYCKTCGIEITLQRLEARPTADQCIDCKTISEKKEI